MAADPLHIKVAQTPDAWVAWVESLPDVTGFGLTRGEAIGELIEALNRQGVETGVRVTYDADRRRANRGWRKGAEAARAKAEIRKSPAQPKPRAAAPLEEAAAAEPGKIIPFRKARPEPKA